MTNFSTTQGANWLIIVSTICNLLNMSVSQSDITGFVNVITGLAVLVGAGISFVNRYRKGDVTKLGMKI